MKMVKLSKKHTQTIKHTKGKESLWKRYNLGKWFTQIKKTAASKAYRVIPIYGIDDEGHESLIQTKADLKRKWYTMAVQHEDFERLFLFMNSR
jgi:hypothetical protein